jgi:hypothetical protein
MNMAICDGFASFFFAPAAGGGALSFFRSTGAEMRAGPDAFTPMAALLPADGSGSPSMSSPSMSSSWLNMVLGGPPPPPEVGGAGRLL